MLNRQSASVPYNLGRLFAALEQAQWAAMGKVNATIRDKYFGAFMATPAHILPVVMGMAEKAYLTADKAGWMNPVVDDICQNIPAKIPAVLQLQEQGELLMGYHHQRAELRKRPDSAEADDNLFNATEKTADAEQE